MEFVSYDAVRDLLRNQGIREVPQDDDQVYLEMEDDEDIVHLHLSSPETQALPREGARVVKVAKDRLPAIVEHVLNTLPVREVLLIPVGKWRTVFDAVAFSLAENEDWQAIDAAATVELNTRDPLLCEPGDFHTLNALIAALLSDAVSPDQGLMMLTASTPVLVEIVADGAVRISLGNPVLADEVAEVVTA